MQTGLGRIKARAQLLVVLLRCQQLLAQGSVVVSQRLTKFSDLADFGFEGIEFGVHERDYRGRCAHGQSHRSADGYNARLQVPTRLSAAEDKRETGARLFAVNPVLPPQR